MEEKQKNPESPMKQGRRGLDAKIMVALLMLLALAIRVPVAFSRGAIGGDETVYAHMAEQIARGNGLLDMLGEPSTVFFPLLPVLVGGLSLLVGDVIIAGYSVEILFGCLLLIPAFLLGRDLIGEKAGLYTAALVAVLPLTVEMSTRLYTESVFAFFLLLGAFCGWRMLHGRALWYAPAAGGSLGLAYLANPSGISFLFAFILIMGVMTFMKIGRRRRLLTTALIFGMTFIALAAPYVIYLHGELGAWTYSGKSGYDAIVPTLKNISPFSLEFEKEANTLTEDGTQFVGRVEYDESPDALSYFLTHPRQAVKVFSRSYAGFYQEELFKVLPLWLLPLLGLGLFASGWNRERLKAVAYTLLFLSPLLMILAIEYRARFSMPFVSFILIWVAAGWIRLEDWARETALFSLHDGVKDWVLRWAAATIAVIVVVPLVLATVYDAGKAEYKTEFREAGEWIKNNYGSGKNVMDREYSAAYYAGGTAVLIPNADYEGFTDFARLKGVDFLVIKTQTFFDWRPDVAGMVIDENRQRDWRLVETEQEGTSREVLVFELQK